MYLTVTDKPNAGAAKMATKYEWVKEKLEAGYTVDLSTATRITRLKPKHLPMVCQDKNGRLMIGKIDYEWAKASAHR
jgi:hypothetical protein